MAIDVVQRQITELNEKVDGLHTLLQQCMEQIDNIASVQSATASNGSLNARVDPDGKLTNISPAKSGRVVDPSMVHKDVLSDDPHMEGEKGNAMANLSPEVQVQRLTAQLTAAYNRMAALEEQILACRFQ